MLFIITNAITKTYEAISKCCYIYKELLGVYLVLTNMLPTQDFSNFSVNY